MLSVLQINENEQWDKLVKSFKQYDVYYLSSYTKAFQLHGDGDPVLFSYEDCNIKAMNVAMKRDIEKNQYFTGKIPPHTLFDITTPYGYGGFIVEGNITNESINSLNEEYCAYCKNAGIITEFVRFHPLLNNSKAVSQAYEIITLGKTVTLDLGSKEQIWSNLISKNRNMIRKAQKNGVKIYCGLNPELLKVFIPLYNSTMDKDKAKDYYYFNTDFYDSFLIDMKYNALIFYAVYQEKIIAMSIFIFANQQMHYHLSASDFKYKTLAPTNLLIYEAACWGHTNGYKTLHLGGGLGSTEDSLLSFKNSFNRNSNSYYSIGRKIFDKDIYNNLIEIRKHKEIFDESTSFFPLYRG